MTVVALSAPGPAENELVVAIPTTTVAGSTTTSTSGPATTTTTDRPDPTTTTAPVPGSTAPNAGLSQSKLIAPPSAGPSGDPGAGIPAGAVMVTVTSITDGDTLSIELDDGTVADVRLIGIDSPETDECFADEGRLALTALAAPGSRVGVTVDVSDRDQFDRLLRYLWVGGMSVNEELVRRGTSIARRYPPDIAMADRLDAAQRAARESGFGLWAPEACGPRSVASLTIVDLVFDAPGDDSQNLNEEWLRIRNDGDVVVELTGWGIRDESAGNRFRFPDGFTLASGETVEIRSGCGTDFDTVLYWCSVGSAIWNNDGDTVFLLDPSGNVHATRQYAGEPPTTTAAPVTTAQGFFGGGDGCDPSYPGVCIPPSPPDLDCPDVSFRRFRVVAPDPHGFDGDQDGVGCES